MVNQPNGSATGIQLFQDGQESWIMEVPASSTALRWTASGTEQMRLNTTGLGIGTSSPSSKLEVSNTGDSIVTITGNTASGNVAAVDFKRNGGTVNASIRSQSVGSNDAGEIFFSTRPVSGSLTERMRLNSSGNLGLGVTPSAWGSNYKAIEVAGASAGVVSANVNSLNFGTNFRNDNTNWIYTFTGQLSTRYEMNFNGQHRWFIAPSGTAGNAITFSQAMTLDASSNLGIATTAPLAKLHVNGNVLISTFSSGTGSTFAGLSLGILGGSADGGAVRFNPSASFTGDVAQVRGIPSNWGVNSAGALTFLTNGGSDTSPFERMRLDSSGNLGIGTSSPGAKLDVVGAARASNATHKGDIIIQQSSTALAGTGGLELVADASSSGYGARIQSIFNGSSAYDLSFQLRNNSASWTQRMLLDASGNLGLGVTPSAWGSIFKVMQLGGGASYVGGRTDTVAGRQVWLGSNSYYNGTNWIYGVSQPAAQYYQNDGSHIWNTAPSGTAGNAITFTQAMTLTAAGNLGIGTTSPSTKLHVVDSFADFRVSDVPTGYATAALTTTDASAGGGALYKTIANTTVEGGLATYIATETNVTFGITRANYSLLYHSGGNGLLLGTIEASPVIIGTNNAERMRITSSGNQIDFQPAESAQNTSVTLTVANLQAQIITSNAAVTLTLPTGTSLEGYTTSMATNTAFECVFIATTANAITIAANGNTTVGNLTVSGNTSGTFRFRKTALNTFTVYRVA
jgi:hypothetical protein